MLSERLSELHRVGPTAVAPRCPTRVDRAARTAVATASARLSPPHASPPAPSVPVLLRLAADAAQRVFVSEIPVRT
jgi:hypothetical protein